MYSGPNFNLGETIDILRDSIYQFSCQEIAPLAAQIDQENQFPRDLWIQLGQMGLLGITVAEEFGGANLGYLAQAIAMEEISRASASVGLSYAAHANLCVNQLFSHGNLAQKQKYLPKLVSGEWIGALAISETEAGSDAMNMKLMAKQDGDHWILNGHKMWITNGPDADVILVYARTPEQTGKELSTFIVEKKFAGFSTGKSLSKLGMRGSNTCELIFKDCIIPKENILGSLYKGRQIMVSGLNYERVVLAAGPIGIMQACLDIILPYVHQRKQFKQSIGHFQLIQAKIADIYTELNASRSYLYTIAQACDIAPIAHEDAASVILYSAEKATQIALQAIQILGGNGYMDDYATGRLLRDAKLYEIGAGTSEIRRLLIGQALFKKTNPEAH